MELRDIEIFLTLAEELHFGRTAARLYVSVTRVSQAIRKQEREVGAKLFDRDSRNVTLTPIGEQLRDDLQPVYLGLRNGMERARQAARGVTGRLRVGMIPHNAHDLKPIWDAFRTAHPQWELRIQHNPYIDAFEPLRNGEIDALISWLPIEEPDLTVGPLVFTEPKMLIVPVDHPLAGQGPVSIEVIGERGVVAGGLPVPLLDYWVDAYTPFYTPKGRAVERHPTPNRSVDDIFTAVGTGEGIHLMNAHMHRYHPRPDVVFTPLKERSQLRFGLVWRTNAETEPVRALARIVRELGPAALYEP
ncbi:LysR family transcriptional regulator [Nocardia sp. IFM 10818]